MASTRIDSLHAGLSLAGRLSAADVAIGVVHSWHAVQSARKIAVAGLRDALSGNTRGHTLQLFSERSEERRVGKGVVVRVDLGGRRIIKKKKTSKQESNKR